MNYCLKIYDGNEVTHNRDIYVLSGTYYSKKECKYIEKLNCFVDEEFLKCLDTKNIKIFDNRTKAKLDKK